MEQATFLMGIIPLVIFVIADSFTNLKVALILAIIFAFGELFFSLYYFNDIDFVTLISFGLILGTGLLSLKLNSPNFIKFQPVILGVILGLIFLISYFMGKPILYEFAMKYREQLPTTMKQHLANPMIVRLYVMASHMMAYALFLHALAIAYAAIKLSKWWWLIIRGVGLYFFIFLAFIASNILLQQGY